MNSLVRNQQRVAAFSIGVCIWIMALAAWLRFPHLFSSFWLDELHTAWIVAGDWAELNARSRIGNQSPLYFAGLRLWAGFFGASEPSLRSPSLVAGMALIVSVIVVVRRFSSSWLLAMFAALLVGLDRRHLFYATEARPYAVVQLVALWHVVLTYWLWSREDDRRPLRYAVRGAWILGAAMLVHLHYTTSLLLAAEVLWLLAAMLRAGGSRADWSARAIDLTLAVLLILPAFPHVLEIANRRQLWSGFGSADGIVLAFTVLDAHKYIGPALLFSVVAYLATGWRTAGAPDDSGPEAEQDAEADTASTGLGLWLSVALGPCLIAWVCAAVQLAPLFFSRYLIASATPTIAAAVLMLAGRKSLSRALGCAFILLVVIAMTPAPLQYFQWGGAINDRREDWRGANGYAFDVAERSNALLLIRSGLLESPLYFERLDEPLIREYLCFPLHADYPDGRSAPAPVFPLADHRALAPVRGDAIRRLRLEGRAVMVIRGRKADANNLLRQLREQLQREDRWVTFQWGPPFGSVHVITIETRKKRRY